MAEDPRVEKIISESKKKARQKVERRRRARNNQKGEKFDWKDADVPAEESSTGERIMMKGNHSNVITMKVIDIQPMLNPVKQDNTQTGKYPN